MTLIEVLNTVVLDALWSALAAAGFAILFNVPRRALLGCIVTGAVGHSLRTLLMLYGFTIEAATLTGATAVGFLAWGFARHYQIPSLIFAVCGTIPMVPGSYAYRAMIGLIRVAGANPIDGEAVLIDAWINFVKTGLILLAIAAGIAAPTLLFRRRRPIV